MIVRCIGSCLRQYGKDASWKVIAIIVGCILTAAALGDVTGTVIAACLAATGISDFTMAISACIANCIRKKE
jgi:hypothetical protein